MLNKLLQLRNHQGFLKYLKNTSWMMGEQFLRIVAGLFVGIWVARYLGPEQFGIFSYALAFTAIFSGIAKLGLDGIMVRELINHPEKRDVYLGTAFWIKVIGAFFVMGLMAVIVPFTNNDTATNFYIFIIATGLVFQSFEVIEFYFQSQVLARVVSICKVIQLIISSSIKVYLVLAEVELFWFFLVATFDTVSLGASYIIAYRTKKSLIFFNKFDFLIAKKLLNESWSLIFSSIVVMVYMRIDQVMIKEMLGEYEVGIYSVSVRLVEFSYFIPIMISKSFFPAVLNAKNTDSNLYLIRLQRLYAFVIWVSIIMSFFVFIFGDLIIKTLFGDQYLESSSVFIILIWCSVFVFFGSVWSNWMLLENQNKTVLILHFLSMLSNIALNSYLIPKFGVIGAATATILSYSMGHLVFAWFFRGQSLAIKMFCKSFIFKGLK